MGIVRFEPTGPHAAGLPRVEPHSPDVLDSPEPAQYRHLYVNAPEYGLRVGIWRCTPFATKLIRQRSHELVIVVDGEVVIADKAGHEHRYVPGDSFVLQGGLLRRWIHKTDATVYFMSHEGVPSVDPEAPITIDVSVPLSPSTPPAAELLLSDAPSPHIKVFHEDQTARFSAGIWDATPYHRKTIPFPRYELMHLLDGEVSFTSENGETVSFQKGDTFLVPHGAVADWKNPVYVRKIFGVFKPAA